MSTETVEAITEDARNVESTDVIIVGAGPIGLELAVALQSLGVDYLQFDAGQVGETVRGYPPATTFFSSADRIAIAGVPLRPVHETKATREQYLSYLHGVVQQFDLPIRSFEEVTDLRPDAGGFRVETPRSIVSARQVILAIGDMHQSGRLDIPGEDQPHVVHRFSEATRYFRRKVLIVGGKNSAVEAALRCHKAGAQVAISYRRSVLPPKSIKYWLLPEIKALIGHGAIGFFPETVPVAIDERSVTLAPWRDGAVRKGAEHQIVDAEDVLVLIGYRQDKTLFRLAGVTLEGENGAPWVDPETMMTDVPGLYVAGTAAAGTQKNFKLFIENSHPHVRKIVRAITGREVAPGLINNAAETYGLAES